jgi:signal peptidase I
MSRGMRETVESIAIALALAFLFKTFEAEAYVIPTGSMAPTLMGRHKDVVCPQCGFQYTASSSDETDRNGYEHHDPNRQVVACTCPICRFTMSTEPSNPQVEGRNPNPSYSGDRIWVSKVTYQFTDPRRFDVMVFRYPDEAETYYIKRLVGLPNETIKIQHGDLFVKGPQEEDFTIVRKSPEKLRAMAQLVHDSDYVSEALLKHNWPTRWQEWGLTEQNLWQVSDDTRSYSIDGAHPGDAWIRYEHTVPSEENWFRELWPPEVEARPQLITDFYAFNTRILRQDRGPEPQALGMHWVGDLMLDCEFEVRNDQGTLMLDLVKGGRHFGCQIDVATGKATLSIDGVSSFHPTADTSLRGPGTYQVAFANADRQLTLWIDGKPVEFSEPTSYDDLGNDSPRSTPDDPGDLAPVGIGSRGLSLEVRHLKVLRDIYYIADKNVFAREPISDYPERHFLMNLDRRKLADFFASPDRWVNQHGRSVFDARKSETFVLGPDQFFVLGDNSPASSDARLWRDNYVSRDLLVGKALLIYWPHPLRLFIPGTDVSLGIIPNVGEMELIR